MPGTAAVWIIVLLFLTGCRSEILKLKPAAGEEDYTGGYVLVERFEISEGPYQGVRGSNSYTIHVRNAKEPHQIQFENYAQAYTLTGERRGDSVMLGIQRFPFHNDSVSIFGNGKFSSDSLYLDLYSGGPAGQIKSVCTAKRLK